MSAPVPPLSESTRSNSYSVAVNGTARPATVTGGTDPVGLRSRRDVSLRRQNMVNVAERLRVVIDDENARVLSRSGTVPGGIGRRTGGGPSIARKREREPAGPGPARHSRPVCGPRGPPPVPC